MKKILTLLLVIITSVGYSQVSSSIGNENKFIENSIIKDIEKYYQDDYGNDLKLLKKETDSIIKISYENIPENKDDYVFTQISIRIPKKGKNILYGDLNNDNLEDIIVIVNTEGGGAGGNVWWDDIFIFFKDKDKYLLPLIKTNWQISGCDREFGFNGGSILIEEIEGNIIKGTSLCYTDKDSRCCPSLIYETQLQIINNQIVTKKRNLIKNNR